MIRYTNQICSSWRLHIASVRWNSGIDTKSYMEMCNCFCTKLTSLDVSLVCPDITSRGHVEAATNATCCSFDVDARWTVSHYRNKYEDILVYSLLTFLVLWCELESVFCWVVRSNSSTSFERSSG